MKLKGELILDRPWFLIPFLAMVLMGCDFRKEEVDPLEEELVTPEEGEALEEYVDGPYRKG